MLHQREQVAATCDIRPCCSPWMGMNRVEGRAEGAASLWTKPCSKISTLLRSNLLRSAALPQTALAAGSTLGLYRLQQSVVTSQLSSMFCAL